MPLFCAFILGFEQVNICWDENVFWSHRSLLEAYQRRIILTLYCLVSTKRSHILNKPAAESSSLIWTLCKKENLCRKIIKQKSRCHVVSRNHMPLMCSLIGFIDYPAGNYTFEVNKRKTITGCEICSKSTIKIPKRQC